MSEQAYLVFRTSGEDVNVDEAREMMTPCVDCRIVDDPAKLNMCNDWYSIGTNHRIVNGRICRDMTPELRWVADVPDIRAFIAKYGRCVVHQPSTGSDFFEIEIYDDYRE